MDNQIFHLCKELCRIFEWAAGKRNMGGKRDRGKQILYNEINKRLNICTAL
jgi:hypothetical protein